MSWAQSLIRLSTYEVEMLQKRLAEVVERRRDVEMRLMLLAAEAVSEAEAAQADAEAGWFKAGYLEGLRMRKAQLQAELHRIGVEEAGARDVLAQAFEEQKKYEHVAETMRLAAVKESKRKETVVLDELGRRAASGR